MPAAFEGSSFLITYPKSDFELIALQTFFKSLADYKYSLISSEKHEDGTLHRHAIVYFNKRQRLPANYFDFLERHPNIKPVGKKKSDWDKCQKYVRKDGDFVEDGTPRHEVSVWSEIAASSSREEALHLIKSEKPRDFVLQARNIDYFLDKVFPVRETPSFIPRCPEQFILPDSIQEWVLGNYRYVLPPPSPQGGLLSKYRTNPN